MAVPLSDEIFARTLNQMGIATLDQIEAATRIQKESSNTGASPSLADVLVQQGIITQPIRENVEKKAQVALQGGIKQLGAYKILKKIGEGGMGAVYLADDTAVGRKVALKILPKKYASDQTFLSRFRREAKATGKLNHVNIVTAYTTGEDMGVHYYAMEFCEGEPLDAKLLREKALTWDKAIEITMQVARGLKHAHEHGLIHRDIKPANILLTKDGVAKILDLGLSKNIGDAEQSFATQTGVAMGTPHYISPEQARGDKGIDGRTDIYSLGATVYHLVTGQTPFQGSTAAMIMMQHLTAQLPNPQDIQDDIPDGIVLVIQKMMAKEPGDRYRNCDELLRDLELVIDGKMPSTHGLDEGKSSVAMRQKIAPPRRNAPRGTHPVQQRKATPNSVRAARPDDATQMLPAKKPAKNSALLIGGGVAAAALIAVCAFALGGKKNEDAPNIAEKTQPVQTVSKQPAVAADDAWVKEVQALPAAEQYKRVNEEMKRLNHDGLPDCKFSINNGHVAGFESSADHTHTIAPVRALKDLDRFVNHSVGKMTPLKDISPLKGTKVKVVELEGTSVADLSPLRGMTLDFLGLDRTPVSDLTPLSSSKIGELNLVETKIESIAALEAISVHRLSLARTAVVDLSPLKKMTTLEHLYIQGTRVASLEPLRNTAIVELNIAGCKIADLSPLRDMPKLASLVWDVDVKRDLPLLRSLKGLTKINGTAKDEFFAKAESADPAATENPLAKTHAGDWLEYSIKIHAPGQDSEGIMRQTVKSVTAKEILIELVATINGKTEKKDLRINMNDTSSLSPLQGLGVNLIPGMTQKEMQTESDDIKVGAKLFKTRWTLQNLETTYQGNKIFETIKTWICPDVPLSGLVKTLVTGTLEMTIELRDFGHGAAQTTAAVAGNMADPASTLALDLGGGVKMEMVLVKAGEFAMGSNDGEGNEKPVHKVKISQPYYIGKYEVTVAQFRRFAEMAKYETECERGGNKGWTVKDGKWQSNVEGINWKMPGFKQEDNHPVVLVTWNDAQAFVAWASKLAGRTVRLPSEAEWEYAARGPKVPKYPWGDNWDGATSGNVGDASLRATGFNMIWGEIKENDGFPYTSPVGNYKNSASWCGAFDMAGNVWELVEDASSDNYYAESPAVDPKGPVDGNYRVIRGGSWIDGSSACRSAHRIGLHLDFRHSNVGFRVAVPAISGNAAAPPPKLELFDQPGSTVWLPAGFKYEKLADVNQPMDIDIGPDGRLWIAGRDGTVWAYSFATKQKTQIAKVAIDMSGERGLHGILCDPEFSNNGFLYLYYTSGAGDKNTIVNRLVRVTVAENGRGKAFLPNSEKVLLEVPSLIDYHQGGALKYNPKDKKLYVTIGDNNNPREWQKFFGDPKNQAQDLADLHGKVLRLNLDGSIPADNPFVGKHGARGEIFSVGHRNPYSMNVDAPTGRIFIGEMGYDLKEDYDEINLLQAGGNFGWPLREGPADGKLAGPSKDPSLIDPWLWYTRENGSGVTSGPICRASAGEFAFPAHFHGGMFYADYVRRWVRFVSIDPASGKAGAPVDFAIGIPAGPLSMLQGPDGALYLVEHPNRISRIVHQPDNAPPTLSLDLGGGVTMEMELIKPGTFEMGSPEGEKERGKNEKQHTVTISKAFYMGKYPVTQEQYEAVTGKTPSQFKGAKNPVEQVSWDDAQEFCKALHNKAQAKLPQGMEVQLPTEAQWEYACRAGTKTRFYTGDEEEDLARAGWYTKNSDGKTHPVSQKTPNAFGLYDMHGNVWQWCQDLYRSDYEKLSATDPMNKTDGKARVLRGGSWNFLPYDCRSAVRSYFTPVNRGIFIGFRIVVSLD